MGCVIGVGVVGWPVGVGGLPACLLALIQPPLHAFYAFGPRITFTSQTTYPPPPLSLSPKQGGPVPRQGENSRGRQGHGDDGPGRRRLLPARAEPAAGGAGPAQVHRGGMEAGGARAADRLGRLRGAGAAAVARRPRRVLGGLPTPARAQARVLVLHARVRVRLVWCGWGLGLGGFGR
jgi:hypothetical protein